VIDLVLRDIFRTNLGVKKNERVLLFTDKPSENEVVEPSDKERRLKLRCLSLFASEVGKSYCKKIHLREYPATGGHGVEPPEEIWEIAFGKKAFEALSKEGLLVPLINKVAGDQIKRAEEIIRKRKNDAVNCVIALSNYSTTHTSFRYLLTGVCGARYASMPLFDISMLEGPMAINWKALEKRTKKLATIVNKAESIELETPNGTHLSFSKKGRKALSDTGILTRAGAFGNLPAGEVSVAPVEGTAHGRLVLEWAPTRRLNEAITLTVRDGYVVSISGEEEYVHYLSAKFAERRENANIAEFGIGTNNRATRPDNILESEKILGTIHIGLGDNTSFGGTVKTPFHQDFVFFKPTVNLIYKDGSKHTILKMGRLV